MIAPDICRCGFIGPAASNTKLALDRTPVKAGRSWTARRPAGGALDWSNQTVEPPPRQIDDAILIVKVAEERGLVRLY